jgi:hypothetical protein
LDDLLIASVQFECVVAGILARPSSLLRNAPVPEYAAHESQFPFVFLIPAERLKIAGFVLFHG